MTLCSSSASTSGVLGLQLDNPHLAHKNSPDGELRHKTKPKSRGSGVSYPLGIQHGKTMTFASPMRFPLTDEQETVSPERQRVPGLVLIGFNTSSHPFAHRDVPGTSWLPYSQIF